jgi:hypothetical protein
MYRERYKRDAEHRRKGQWEQRKEVDVLNTVHIRRVVRCTVRLVIGTEEGGGGSAELCIEGKCNRKRRRKLEN